MGGRIHATRARTGFPTRENVFVLRVKKSQRKNDKGGGIWKHVTSGELSTAHKAWEEFKGGKSSGSIIREDCSPTTDCLCTRPKCFYAVYRTHVEAAKNETKRRCTVWNSANTSQWRTPGAQYAEMQVFYQSAAGIARLEYPLTLDKAQLTSDSDVCAACLALMRNNGRGTKVSTEIHLTRLTEDESGDGRARSKRSVSIAVTRELNSGKPVCSHRAVSMLAVRDATEGRSSCDAPARYDTWS